MVQLTILTAEDKRRIKQQLARDRLQSSGYTPPTGLTPAQQKAQRDYYNKLKKEQDDFDALQAFRKKAKAIADAKKKLDQDMRNRLLEYQRTTSGLLPSEERAINSMSTAQLKASIKRMEAVLNEGNQEMRDRLLEYERTTSGLLPSEERAINSMTTEQLKASIKRMEAVQQQNANKDDGRRAVSDSEDDEDDKDPHKEKTTHHPEIVREKAIELLLLSADSYKAGDEVNNGDMIEETDNLYDTQVVVYRRSGYKVVAFRGTWENIDWLANIATSVVKLSSIFKFIQDDEDIMVHKGFAKAVLPVYRRIKERIGDSRFDLTGHSQGSALAGIFAYVYALDTGDIPRYFYTYGSPRFIVDNPKYPAKRFDDLLDMVRFQNDNDIVTYYPHKGDTHTIGKHATAGGIVGGVVGGLGGASVGTAVGGAFGMASSGTTTGYKHVGTGVMLFDPEVENVIQFQGQKKLLEDRNYFLLREGADFLKDPLDTSSTISQTLVKLASSQLTIKAIENFSYAPDYKKFFEEQGKDNVISRIKNVFNINFRSFLGTEIVERMMDSRLGTLQGRPFAEASERDVGGTLWTRTAQYLTGELLDRYVVEERGLRRFRVDLRKEARGGTLLPLEQFGFLTGKLPNENLNAYFQLHKEIVEYYLNEQLRLDTLTAKQFYKYVGLQLFSESVLTYYLVSGLIGKVEGHTTKEYGRRLTKLPDVIYEGFTDTDEIIVENSKYSKLMKNLYIKDGDPNDRYYLHHAKGKSQLRKMENKIYGYILYDPNEENSYLNKLIVL